MNNESNSIPSGIFLVVALCFVGSVGAIFYGIQGAFLYFLYAPIVLMIGIGLMKLQPIARTALLWLLAALGLVYSLSLAGTVMAFIDPTFMEELSDLGITRDTLVTTNIKGVVRICLIIAAFVYMKTETVKLAFTRRTQPVTATDT